MSAQDKEKTIIQDFDIEATCFENDASKYENELPPQSKGNRSDDRASGSNIWKRAAKSAAGGAFIGSAAFMTAQHHQDFMESALSGLHDEDITGHVNDVEVLPDSGDDVEILGIASQNDQFLTDMDGAIDGDDAILIDINEDNAMDYIAADIYNPTPDLLASHDEPDFLNESLYDV